MNPFEAYSGWPGIEIRLANRFSELHRVFESLEDQKSETCGPYSILKIYRSLNSEQNEDLTEDRIAQICGTVISTEEEEISSKLRGISHAALDKDTREKFYPLEMLVSDDEKEQGTSAEGVQKAAEIIFGSGYRVIPFFGSRKNEENITSKRFSDFSNFLWDRISDLPLNMIFNVQVDLLCSNSSIKDRETLVEFLNSTDCTELDDWKVGHFVILAGMIRVSSLGGQRYFYILQDNYKGRGWSGYLFQPEHQLRKAMMRNDQKEGGMILIYPVSEESTFEDRMHGIFEKGIWDNGTPFKK